MGLGLGLRLGIARRIVASGGGGGFYPTDVANLTHMWDMHDSPRYSDAAGTTLIGAGNQVCASIRDLKSGRLLFQDTEAYQATIIRGVQNGRDVLRMGEHGYFSGTPPFGLAINYEETLILIERITSTGDGRRTLDSNNSYCNICGSRSNGQTCYVNGAPVSDYYASSGCHMLRLWIPEHYSASKMAYFVDEIDRTDTQLPPNNWGELQVGKVPGWGAPPQSDVCCIMRIHPDPSAEDIANIHAWAIATWGTQE